MGVAPQAPYARGTGTPSFPRDDRAGAGRGEVPCGISPRRSAPARPCVYSEGAVSLATGGQFFRPTDGLQIDAEIDRRRSRPVLFGNHGFVFAQRRRMERIRCERAISTHPAANPWQNYDTTADA